LQNEACRTSQVIDVLAAMWVNTKGRFDEETAFLSAKWDG